MCSSLPALLGAAGLKCSPRSEHLRAREDGHTQLSRAYNGPSEVVGYFEQLPHIGATFTFELHDLLAHDEHGVALLAGTAERSGERIKQKVIHVFHLNADGKITEWWTFWEDQEALDDLLA